MHLAHKTPAELLQAKTYTFYQRLSVSLKVVSNSDCRWLSYKLERIVGLVCRMHELEELRVIRDEFDFLNDENLF